MQEDISSAWDAAQCSFYVVMDKAPTDGDDPLLIGFNARFLWLVPLADLLQKLVIKHCDVGALHPKRSGLDDAG